MLANSVQKVARAHPAPAAQTNRTGGHGATDVKRLHADVRGSGVWRLLFDEDHLLCLTRSADS